VIVARLDQVVADVSVISQPKHGLPFGGGSGDAMLNSLQKPKNTFRKTGRNVDDMRVHRNPRLTLLTEQG
jgi:hypothetical protein